MSEINYKYFEDWEVGVVFISPTRTITESDIVTFAGFSGDYSQLHTSKEYAERTIFKERAAHGLLGLAIAGGLECQTEGLCFDFQKTGIASLGWTWDFRKPIRIGDTMHMKLEMSRKRMTKNSERGILYFSGWLINQKGEVIQEGEHRLMVKTRAAKS